MSYLFECPSCGKQTTGGHSKSGIHWPLCQLCIDEAEKETEREQVDGEDKFAVEMAWLGC